MTDMDAVARAVRAAIEETNGMLDVSKHIGTSPQTPLIGSGIDSLTLINLVVAIEEHVEDATGAHVSLADRLGRDTTAFATVGSLTEHLRGKVQGADA